MGKSFLRGFVAAALVFGGLTGCGKKDESVEATPAADASAPADATATAAPAPPPAAPAGAETLPGANAVRDALAKKDYETTVGGLLALRGAATGDRQQEYVNLYAEVMDTLRAESSTDRKAAQALAGLMASSRGR
jgi:predicted small lipoprotein YifL